MTTKTLRMLRAALEQLKRELLRRQSFTLKETRATNEGLVRVADTLLQLLLAQPELQLPQELTAKPYSPTNGVPLPPWQRLLYELRASCNSDLADDGYVLYGYLRRDLFLAEKLGLFEAAPYEALQELAEEADV